MRMARENTQINPSGRLPAVTKVSKNAARCSPAAAARVPWRSEPAEKGAPPPELHYQTGEIVLSNKVTTLHLNADYRYLDP